MTAADLTDIEAPEARLAALGLTLPAAPGAVANYVPWAVIDNVVMTSGQLPWIDGDLKYKGRIGAALSGEEGYQACRLSALNAIAQLRAAAGSLDRIRRVFRLEGTLNVAEDYRDHPQALNGASDLVNQVFGARGPHLDDLHQPGDAAGLRRAGGAVRPARPAEDAGRR
ncbi:MAG: RidA family protein [Alphaproteobacteria bacterium]